MVRGTATAALGTTTSGRPRTNAWAPVALTRVLVSSAYTSDTESGMLALQVHTSTVRLQGPRSRVRAAWLHVRDGRVRSVDEVDGHLEGHIDERVLRWL